jgi:hypothetical protein
MLTSPGAPPSGALSGSRERICSPSAGRGRRSSRLNPYDRGRQTTLRSGDPRTERELAKRDFSAGTRQAELETQKVICGQSLER